MARALTDQERYSFNYIHDSDSNVGLIQATFDGEETAVIAAFDEDEDSDNIIVTPIAILITPAMFDRITDPDRGLNDHRPNSYRQSSR